MVYNFLRGEASINVLAQHCGVKVVVVDLGVAAKIKPLPASKYPFVDRKIRLGAKNIARGPAMSRKSALLSIKAGIEVFEQQYQQGVDLAGTGEMGIGNTTPSAAIASVIIDSSPEAVTGRGTGLSPAAWQEKVKVVSRAIKINRPDPQDPLDVLAKIGGLEIGGLVGWILAGAAYNVPMVIDGFISTAAALLAVKFSPEVKNYLIAAHQSKEKGHKLMLKYLKLKPLLNLQMRLGEGTGAALGMFIIEAAIKIFHQVATFQQAQVTPGRLE
jgi:nicotinate-nucleotide--dimethylbenzimidazole phosphoribosyltransferase